MHTVIGFFDKPDFKTYSLMRSLESELGAVRFIVAWDNPSIDRRFDFEQFNELRVIDKMDLVKTLSHQFSVDSTQLQEHAEGYKPLYKILLAFYCRKVLNIDYCIMTDNDIFFFESIDEIKQLSVARQPFLIQEPGDSYRIPDISNLIKNCFGRNDTSPVPNKGKGYNIGFCGLDLSMYDVFEIKSFGAIMEMFSRLDVWWKEQAFVVSMMFSFSGRVHTFEHQKYLFLWHIDPRYRAKSKIYHCIGTSDKSVVDYYYKQGSRARFAMAFKRVRFLISSMVLPIRRIVVPIYRRMFKIYKPNANRYLHLLEHLNQTHCVRILEIGVWRGDTAILMLQYSKNRQVEYHGIDVFEGSTPELVEKEVSLVAVSMENVLKRLHKFSRSVFLYKGYSTDVFPNIKDASLEFDCIWIDGGHSYETVKFDFDHYSQLLRQGGTIFIDDYTNDSMLPDVKRFVDNELLNNRRYNVKIHNQHIDTYRGYIYKVVSVQFCVSNRLQSFKDS